MHSRIRWLRQDAVLAVHEAQIAEHGGSLGVRDLGLLESALARPQHLAAYAEPESDVPALAAAYGLGIIRGHPFVDGNKRVALVLVELFLDLNHYDFTASDAECHAMIWQTAAGTASDDEFSAWVHDHAIAREEGPCE
ncbi:MAG TPA: type II toxin-antitoxin system death-on-curing family toxin [Candidatus Dormibacteraeota bacterium]|nr:type II toxin-antitoxin system death-on-curing family toxin [Candidatus Dormibacteraeota bacterium]